VRGKPAKNTMNRSIDQNKSAFFFNWYLIQYPIKKNNHFKNVIMNFNITIIHIFKIVVD
jgi:hypothetical protein